MFSYAIVSFVQRLCFKLAAAGFIAIVVLNSLNLSMELPRSYWLILAAAIVLWFVRVSLQGRLIARRLLMPDGEKLLRTKDGKVIFYAYSWWVEGLDVLVFLAMVWVGIGWLLHADFLLPSLIVTAVFLTAQEMRKSYERDKAPAKVADGKRLPSWHLRAESEGGVGAEVLLGTSLWFRYRWFPELLGLADKLYAAKYTKHLAEVERLQKKTTSVDPKEPTFTSQSPFIDTIP